MNPRDLPDHEIVSLTIFGEAFPNYEVQQAMACIIYNKFWRNPSKYKSYKDVCLERDQFRCWRRMNPAMTEIINNFLAHRAINNPDYEIAQEFANMLYTARVTDIIKNVPFCMQTDTFYNARPEWAAGARDITELYHLTFFNA